MNKVSKTTLGDLIEFQRGYDLPKSQFIDGIYPVQSSNGVLGYHNEYKVKGPGITIGRSGTVGLPHLIKSNFFPHNTSLFIKDFKGNDVNYIYYLLKNLNLGDKKSGSGVPTMNRNHLHPLEILAHTDLYTQTQITKTLSDLDTKIELNNKINTELEVMAKTLYDYWFVQFDFPDVNGKPYKSSGGKMVFNEELKREIPEGWEFSTIKKQLKTSLGGTPSTKIKEYWKGNLSWLNSGEIAEFPIISADEKITQEAINNSAAKLMPIGTVALSITRHIRPSILAIDACANQSVVGIYESEQLNSSYIYPYIKNEVPRFMILRTGAQQPHINKATVDNSIIIVPSDSILKKYYKLANPLYDKIINNAFQSQKLTELKDWLLPMLMNGQVTVVENDTTIETLFEQLNFDYEVAAIVLLTQNRFRVSYGEKYIQKMFSNIEMLNTLPVFKDLVFEEKGWGMYSKAIASTIKAEKFIYPYDIGGNKNVLKVNLKEVKEVSQWMQNGDNQEFVSQVNDMLTIYEKSLINKSMDRIELLNTVLECMKVLETDNFTAIRNKMTNWKMYEEDYKTKAEKFKPQETQLMIDLIKEVK